METMSNKYDIYELPEGIFTITFKIIYCYQWKDPDLIEKHKCKKKVFNGGRNIIQPLTYTD